MKALTSILIIVLVVFVFYKVWDYWDRVSKEKELAVQREKKPFNPSSLSGMEYKFETSLMEAMNKNDADVLKSWLTQHRTVLKDPRLAWIELDYVQLVTPRNPLEAKKVFAAVKARIEEDSPVYKRVKSLEKTYE
jgi:hypothetical protein